MKADLSLLPAEKRLHLEEIVAALAEVPGVSAVALGGSHARGAARPDSDVDLGVYYAEEHPFRIEDIRTVASRFHLRGAPVATDFYEWGPWVNGGAWLETRAGRVDFIYRGLDHVERVIAAARRGEIEWHFGQQPPYGFRSVIYLAETSICVPLHDPSGALGQLKQSTATYPEAMRTAIVRGSLWSAEFTLWSARKFAAAGDVYNTAGCICRVACELTQVLFALNRVYFIGDKGALEAIESFARKPNGYADRLTALMAKPGSTPRRLSASIDGLAALVSATIDLCTDLYQSKYALP